MTHSLSPVSPTACARANQLQTTLTKPPKLYLDLLPCDVVHRILTNFTPDPSHPDSFYEFIFLGESSPHFRLVILQILSSNLVLTRHFPLLERWAALIQPILRELDIRVHPKSSNSGLASLLRAPKLARVQMVSVLPTLRELHGARSLRTLSLDVYTIVHIPLVFECLASLPRLEDLALKLVYSVSHLRRNDHSCCLVPRGNDYVNLARSCPNITKLEVQCLCFSFERCMVWRFAFSLPKICHLIVHQAGSFRDYYNWRYASEVRETIILHPRIERPVKHLSVHAVCGVFKYEARFAESCKPCPKSIFSVPLRLHEDRTYQNARAVIMFPSPTSLLESLEIRKPASDHPYHYGKFECGSILRNIRTMPLLSVLSLHEVVIAKNELVSILKDIGDRLRKLHISIEHQGERAHKRLHCLLHTLATNNTSLRELSIDSKLLIKSERRQEISPFEQSLHQEELRAAYDEFCLQCPHAQITAESRALSYAELEEAVFTFWDFECYSD
ncbi:unnamed protein product [Chondrus crispus]|uniref:F-box domain-containing protein n=1 Tax=Chondrus crispus TaxID=2769 RepID=R7Q9E2_CHOCR|nr:unnamed protein product [Chondrus crispus]CDF33981.1 unnamed protein product [Chondrus crispus]|eukprot:XP_005713800.1 unnamed protein product [Chondrus crispus]